MRTRMSIVFPTVSLIRFRILRNKVRAKMQCLGLLDAWLLGMWVLYPRICFDVLVWIYPRDSRNLSHDQGPSRQCSLLKK